MIEGKLFVFCLAGNSFSDRYLHSYINLQNYITDNGGKCITRFEYTPIVDVTRNQLITGSESTEWSPNPEVFGGREYDYILMIDDDIVFSPEDFDKLLNEDKDIISGWYAKANGKQTVVYIDDNCLVPSAIESQTSPFKCTATGMGFVLIKRGVFEKIEFPWFNTTYYKTDSSCSIVPEDHFFCYKAIQSGFEFYVHPKVHVGHEKLIVL